MLKRGFNSLQTGKHIQRCVKRVSIYGLARFNSLQTGKHIQRANSGGISLNLTRVSIPFKRESIYKVTINSNSKTHETPAFQFPSNGKAYTKADEGSNPHAYRREFQFPSNGKAYTKSNQSDLKIPAPISFQFPSNGKAYTKLFCAPVTGPPRNWFQFPSNGKAYTKSWY